MLFLDKNLLCILDSFISKYNFWSLAFWDISGIDIGVAIAILREVTLLINCRCIFFGRFRKVRIVYRAKIVL